MEASSITETVPLRTGTDGVIRVSGTRVTVDTLIGAFRDGSTAEEIVQQYPSLPLADVYQVLGYYLKHAAELEEYLSRREAQFENIRRTHEFRFDPHGVRDRLRARGGAGP